MTDLPTPSQPTRGNRFRRSANTEVVRRAFEALAEGDLDAALECFDVGAMFEPLSTSVRERNPSEALGHTGLRRYFEDLGATWDEFSITIDDLRESGDHVAALGRIRAVASAAGFDSEDPVGFVCRMRDEKIVWGKTLRTPEEALAMLEELSNGNAA